MIEIESRTPVATLVTVTRNDTRGCLRSLRGSVHLRMYFYGPIRHRSIPRDGRAILTDVSFELIVRHALKILPPVQQVPIPETKMIIYRTSQNFRIDQQLVIQPVHKAWFKYT